jgi:hypothetical protein
MAQKPVPYPGTEGVPDTSGPKKKIGGTDTTTRKSTIKGTKGDEPGTLKPVVKKKDKNGK